ncbi:hypothetical protein DAPPUDRAFT_317954 [Daphnia pulex]|uniref:Uncharacterized protein n=1 Tax=Daphnia pulex TaxID=6669 RepID=E9GHF1_DAPPU|nr:hypothetical protein DAPPUDRAFT_317954 [Daphnia pulex]|eukprot:EFX81183.1 hypothetical protein DAPPUDRAFT_317954 [Daphnia pulex]
MKKLIAGSWTAGSFNVDKFAKSLLLFRNAPRSGAASPAQMVLNRPVRDALPAHRRSFAPEWQQKTDVLEKRARRAKEVQIEHYNKTAHSLPPLSIGDHVVIQHPISKCWSTPAVVVEIGPHRDYLLKTPAGRLFRPCTEFSSISRSDVPLKEWKIEEDEKLILHRLQKELKGGSDTNELNCVVEVIRWFYLLPFDFPIRSCKLSDQESDQEILEEWDKTLEKFSHDENDKDYGELIKDFAQYNQGLRGTALSMVDSHVKEVDKLSK